MLSARTDRNLSARALFSFAPGKAWPGLSREPVGPTADCFPAAVSGRKKGSERECRQLAWPAAARLSGLGHTRTARNVANPDEAGSRRHEVSTSEWSPEAARLQARRARHFNMTPHRRAIKRCASETPEVERKAARLLTITTRRLELVTN